MSNARFTYDAVISGSVGFIDILFRSWLHSIPTILIAVVLGYGGYQVATRLFSSVPIAWTVAGAWTGTVAAIAWPVIRFGSPRIVEDDIHCFAMMEFQPVIYLLFAMSGALAGLTVACWHSDRGAVLGATIGITLGVLYHYALAAGPMSVRPVLRLFLFTVEFLFPLLLAHLVVVLAKWVCRFGSVKIKQVPSE